MLLTTINGKTPEQSGITITSTQTGEEPPEAEHGLLEAPRLCRRQNAVCGASMAPHTWPLGARSGRAGRRWPDVRVSRREEERVLDEIAR